MCGSRAGRVGEDVRLEPLPIESLPSAEEGGDVEYARTRRWTVLLAAVVAVLVVLAVVALLDRSSGQPVVGTRSDAPAPAVSELAWEGPITLEAHHDLRDVDVSRDQAFAVVDGWIASSEDMVAWTHLPVPPGLATDEPVTVGYDGAVFPSAIDGRVIDFDVNGEVVVALVSTERDAADPQACPPRPPPPAARLYASFDRGETWTQVETERLGEVDRDVRVAVDGQVATNGATAIAHTEVRPVIDPRCGADEHMVDLPEVIDRLLVISPDLVTRRSVGTAGPLFVSTAAGYVTGYGGVPPQISTNNGQSFTPLPGTGRTAVVARDILVRPRADGRELSLDLGATWTAPNPDVLGIADAVFWNGSVFVVGWTAGDLTATATFGVEPSLFSTVLGAEGPDAWVEVADFATLHDPQIAALGDRIAVFGRDVGDDGSLGSPVMYLGSRP